jgi:hypothetical protein
MRPTAQVNAVELHPPAQRIKAHVGSCVAGAEQAQGTDTLQHDCHDDVQDICAQLAAAI